MPMRRLNAIGIFSSLLPPFSHWQESSRTRLGRCRFETVVSKQAPQLRSQQLDQCLNPNKTKTVIYITISYISPFDENTHDLWSFESVNKVNSTLNGLWIIPRAIHYFACLFSSAKSTMFKQLTAKIVGTAALKISSSSFSSNFSLSLSLSLYSIQ